MSSIGALIRRTFTQRVLIYQVRCLQSQPPAAASEDEFDAKKSSRQTKTPKILVGQLVEDKFEKFPPRGRPQLKEPPPLLTLIEPEPLENPTPEPDYTDEEKAIFADIGEISKDDALKHYKVSQFDAAFLDSLGPGLKPVYNVAALANKIPVLQKLVQIGVSMYKWDSKPFITKKMMALDWRRDCEPRIDLLLNRGGVTPDDLVHVLSVNPLVLCEEMQHLEARLDYLYDEMSPKPGEGGWGLDVKSVGRIVTKEPFWLSQSIERLENRMQFFTNIFELKKEELRKVLVACPKLILSSLRRVVLNKFSLTEECGFSSEELKNILMISPRVFLKSRQHFCLRFDILHGEMGFEHEILSQAPQVFFCREKRLKERLGFLRHLNRAQFNAKLPAYISPFDIATTSDDVFIKKVAKSTPEQFENYLKLH